MRRRHAEYFVALAESAEPELLGEKEQLWLVRLDADDGNIRTALAWGLQGWSGPSVTSAVAFELGMRLAAALWIFWTARNRQSEGRRWIEASMERYPQLAAALSHSVQMKALNAAGYMAVAQGDHERAPALLEKGLELSQGTQNHSKRASIFIHMGRMARAQGDYERAKRLEEEGLSISKRYGDHWGTAHALLSLGDMALEQGILGDAMVYLQEALTICQDVGLAEWRMWTVYNLGRVAHLQGNYQQSQAWLEECLSQFRDMNYSLAIGLTLLNLGRVALAQKNVPKAAELFSESIALPDEVPGEVHRDALAGLAAVAAAHRQPQRATHVLGFVTAFNKLKNLPIPPAYRVEIDRTIAAILAQLDDATFAAAWEEGQQMTLAQAIAEALADVAAPDGSALDAMESLM